MGREMEIREIQQTYVQSGCLLRPMVWVSVCGALGNLRFALVSKESCQTDNFWESPESQTLRENGRFAAVLVGISLILTFALPAGMMRKTVTTPIIPLVASGILHHWTIGT